MSHKRSVKFRAIATHIIAGTVALFASASASAAPPSTPADLRADVYSQTSAEIFWSRSSDPDGIVRGYEIRQDGTLLTTLDGLSFFTQSLTAGVSTEFTVTAIDFDNERSGTVSITVTGGGGTTSSNSTGDRPTPPANLNAVVYSSTSAEVFWDRNLDRLLSYEVSVNGNVATTTNGTSYFSGNLDAGRSIAIDVVAIDSNGQRSGAANVAVNTTGDASTSQTTAQQPSQPVNPSPSQSSSNASNTNASPPAPTNGRIDVYSGTAAEVFWDRAAARDDVVETIIFRDRTRIGSTQGNSFFDDNRRSGVSYRYELQTINSQGARSAIIVVEDDAANAVAASPSSPTQPAQAEQSSNLSSIINASNSSDLIRQAFEILNGKAFDKRLESSSQIGEISSPNPENIVPGLSVVSVVEAPPSQSEVAAVATITNYSCSNGGTVQDTELNTFPPDHIYDYDNCQINDDTIDGSVTVEATLRLNTRYIFDNYRVTFEPNGVMEVDGTYLVETETRSLGLAVINESRDSNIDYFFEFPGGRLRVSETDFNYNYHLNSCCGDFENTRRTVSEDSTFVMTPPFSDSAFRVTMLSELDNQGEDSGLYFDIGEMRITSVDDGSSLTLNAATGDINTVNVALEQTDGTSSSVDFVWSSWADVFCLSSRRPNSDFMTPTCAQNRL